MNIGLEVSLVSIDCSVSIYFPMSRANAALEATRKILRRPKYRLGILVKAPDGDPIRIPASCALKNGVQVEDFDGQSRWVQVPTISEAFPEVVGPEPIFSLEELSRISLLDVEIAFRKDGQVVDYAMVTLSLQRGRDFFDISFGASNSRDAGRFFEPRFRSRFAKVMEEGGAVVAAYLANGEWYSFADQTPIEDPEGQGDSPGPDGIVAALLKEID